MCRSLLVWAMAAVALFSVAAAQEDNTNCTAEMMPHSRKKRLIFMTSDRRLTFPPQTLLIITPTFSLPFGRNFPTGYGASMTISIPFKVEFDNLGLTSEENPFGIWPEFWSVFRKKRHAELPGVNWAGGDREMLYQGLEDALINMGMDGKGCLLRAICEVFQVPLLNHGFFGEVLELFFSASRSPHADLRLGDYVRAERKGRSTGDCEEYVSLCRHSLFTNPGYTKWEETEAYMDHDMDETSTDSQDEVDPQGDLDSEHLDDRISQDFSASQDKSSRYPKKASSQSKTIKDRSGCKNKPR